VVEYDVVAVRDRRLGAGSFNEDGITEVLNTRARDGWRLVHVVEERTRLLLILERAAP
jgi:hypothetical protein